MRAQMDRALTIGYLCAAAGLNGFELQHGLPALFGRSPKTVFGKRGG
ncbi:hypothetical protein P3W85_36305 [Cupriavidus basilensis]|uniref:Uncharacterized protein n=1 Tax=Cupriavidus basilensis TaxID=68895 RepID=A0ABT6B0D9_9BURK|nr:hypothetical protein [Cupriavidus basilensis]MDF3838354.1 hypothetical protein [Cupriavidus basilensis]